MFFYNNEWNLYVCEELLPHQITHCQNLIESLLAHDCVLDVSDTGTGKTYTALIVSKILKLKPIIICPISVKVAWARVCEELNIPEPFITNYEQLRGDECSIHNEERTPKDAQA